MSSEREYIVGETLGEWELVRIERYGLSDRRKFIWRHSCGYEARGCRAIMRGRNYCAKCGKKFNTYLPKKMHTLCWTCQNYAKGCEWSESRATIPVPGWNAVENELFTSHTVNGVNHIYKTKSYCVLDCPKYKRDEPREYHSTGGEL